MTYRELVTALKERREELGWSAEETASKAGITAEELLAIEAGGDTTRIIFLTLRLALGFAEKIWPEVQLDNYSPSVALTVQMYSMAGYTPRLVRAEA